MTLRILADTAFTATAVATFTCTTVAVVAGTVVANFSSTPFATLDGIAEGAVWYHLPFLLTLLSSPSKVPLWWPELL